LQNTKSSNENDEEKEYTTSNTLVVEFNLNNKLKFEALYQEQNESIKDADI
jgi:hypothetical protein